MAKGKKALASPFVPPDEQPYSIPKNWCWVKLEFVCSGQITDGTHKTPKYCEKNEGVPFVSAKDVTSEYIDWSNVKYIVPDLHQELYKRLAPQKNDILLAKNGTTGVAALVETNDIFDLYVTIAVLRPNIGIILPGFLYRLINSPICKNQFNSHLTGIGVPNLHLRDIKNISIPLPPLSEQRRIVDHIESLFAKLDEAKEKAQAVVDGFELRKSAILHKAFTGELTERWRKEHGVGLDSWKMVSFNDCIQKMQNGLAKRSGSIGESYVVLRLANLSEDGFDTSDLREILLDEKEQETYSLLENDVIMIRVNGSKDNVGRQLLVPDVKKWAFCDHIIRIRYQNNVLPNYMVLFSKSDNYRTYVKDHMVSSAGQNTISRKGMANMAVPIPECDEQREIVRTLSALFNKEQQAKEAAETVLSQIDTMKKAILARAFRGELGTNDSAEESAVELIKSVL